MPLMSAPRLLVVSNYRPAAEVLGRMLGGVVVTCRRHERAVGRRVVADAVVLDVAKGSPESFEELRAWARELAAAGVVVVALAEASAPLWEREETQPAELAVRLGEDRPRALQLLKPFRGPELRGLLSLSLDALVSRARDLSGRDEEMLSCALRVGERFDLSDRELAVVVASLELREREAIAERLGMKKGTVDEHAARIAARTGMPLDTLVRQAWLDWVDAIADDDGSGQFGARARKGSGEVVRAVVGRGKVERA